MSAFSFRSRVFTILVATTACGDDGPSTPITVDAAPVIDAVVLPATCNPVEQDCPTGYKCTFVTPRGILEHGCRAVAGEIAEGGACTGVDGDDNCAAGTFCQSGRCKRFCNSQVDCGATQGCAFYRTGDGTCEDPCTPFDASTCPTGFSCDFLNARTPSEPAVRFCRLIGTVPPGGDCDLHFGAENECEANHTCQQTCMPLCDDTHPCQSGTCRPPTNAGPNPANAGVCAS